MDGGIEREVWRIPARMRASKFWDNHSGSQAKNTRLMSQI
jgi:hypothetical protein